MAQIMAENNTRFLGQTVEVLVEEEHKGKWRGRIPQNKLVFFEDKNQDWRGKLVPVEIVWTGPYSMQGRLHGAPMPIQDFTDEIIPLSIL
jgi:tRNA-2-methylthio-N6-dimethylallyladenosine synthase